jgi:hypothetical protein
VEKTAKIMETKETVKNNTGWWASTSLSNSPAHTRY